MNNKEKNLKNWKYYLNELKITTNARWLSNLSDKPNN